MITAALPYQLGYDYPMLAVALARYRRFGGPPPTALSRPYPIGRRYHWLLGDLWAWLTAMRTRRVQPAALVTWALRMAWLAASSHHLTFEWRDPLPTVHMYWQHLGRRALRRLQPALKANAGAGAH